MTAEVRILKHSDVMACLHHILMPDHYREDGSCRCNDPDATDMQEWGYYWDGERWL